MDLSRDATVYARDKAANAGLKNVEFIAVDLSTFDTTAEPEGFDFVTTFDAIHDQARPLSVLKGIHRTRLTTCAARQLKQAVRRTNHEDRD